MVVPGVIGAVALGATAAGGRPETGPGVPRVTGAGAPVRPATQNASAGLGPAASVSLGRTLMLVLSGRGAMTHRSCRTMWFPLTSTGPRGLA